MSAAKPDDPAWAWSLFWRTGQMHACLPLTDAEAAGHILAQWQAFFAQLNAGARALDLGTGNGAVVAQAALASRAHDLRLEIHGVDLASIDPHAFSEAGNDLLASVHFHPGVAIEALPFPDQSWDAVCGQFALEYSNTVSSIAEAMRVLRPGGQWRFLIHAAEGALTKRAAMQHRQANAILDSALIQKLDAALTAIHAAQHDDRPASLETAQQAINALMACMEILAAQCSSDPDTSLVSNFMAAVKRLPSQAVTGELDAVRRLARDLDSRLRAQAARLEAQAAAACDAAHANALAAAFRAQGGVDIAIADALTGEPPQLIGRWLTGRKAPL